MNLFKLSKLELLSKCEELGITKCKTKNKNELIALINNISPTSNVTEKNDIDGDLYNFTKCDVFTPENISKIMISKLHKKGTLLEPSVGTGNLLNHLSIKNYELIDVYEIKNEYLQKINYINVNKYNEDFIKANIHKKYDNIIMNPPYIKVQDLSSDYRDFLKNNFTLLETGLVDIYYAFIIKCLNLLNNGGVMVSITPNTYLYNKSSLTLRKYLFDNCLIKEIIDFKDQKVFENVSVYCCITVFTKEPKTHLIYNNTNILYSDITKNYSLFNFNSSNDTLKSICKITNGIATLRDNIFIHNKPLYDEPCWKPITNGTTFKSILYPYKNGKIIEEDEFKKENPLSYAFLEQNKDELKKRDNGAKIYPAWYAYGRSQSINHSNKKCIYIPCFIDPQNINTCIYVRQGMLHHGCLCIEPFDENDIDKIIDAIKKNIQFIVDNSSKRSAGWINISSRVLYDVSLNK
jgi:hypothetical protein